MAEMRQCPDCGFSTDNTGKYLAHRRYTHGPHAKAQTSQEPQHIRNTNAPPVQAMQPQQIPMPADISQLTTADQIRAIVDAQVQESLNSAISQMQAHAQGQQSPQYAQPQQPSQAPTQAPGVPLPPPKSDDPWASIAQEGMNMLKEFRKERATMKLLEMQAKLTPPASGPSLFEQLGKQQYELFTAQLSAAQGKATGQLLGKMGVPAPVADIAGNAASNIDIIAPVMDAIKKSEDARNAAQAAWQAEQAAKLKKTADLLGLGQAVDSGSEHALAGV